MVCPSRPKLTFRSRCSSTLRRAFVGSAYATSLVGVTALAQELAPQPAGAIAAEPIEVTVQGNRGETRPGARDSSVASSVIPRARLEAPGVQAPDVLRTQPGVIITESGGFGAPATASIRGATAADTPVYLAGLRLNDDVGGTADLSMIPLWLIQQVEIYRGNAPLDADRLGPGGAIFFEPKRPTKSMGGAGYYGGSWGTSRTWGYQGSRQGPISYLVGVSADRASNRYPFANDQGMLLVPGASKTEYRRNADVRTVEGWFLGRAELGRGYKLDWVGNLVQREQGVPRLALLQSRTARQKTTRELGSVSLKGPLVRGGKVDIEARFSVLRGLVHFEDPDRELALYAHAFDFDSYRFEQQTQARIEVTERLRLRPVLSLSHEALESIQNDLPLRDTGRNTYRLGSNVEYETTRDLTLRALVTGECHHTGVRDKGYCDELAPTGRLGGELRFESLSILASAGRYLRVPTLGENYGISGTVHGNEDLAPESGATLDVGVRTAAYPGKLLRKVYLDAFGYARYASDLVAYTRTGQGFVRPYNVNSARVLGAELLAGARLTELVGLEVSCTFMDPRDTSEDRLTTNDVLPYRSKLLLSPRLSVDWRRHRRLGLSGAGGQLSLLYQSSRYADPAGLAVIDEQLTTDLEVYAQGFDGLLTLRGRVADLFDAKRTDVVGYPLPGRSIYLGLEAQY
jgi:iron complex outermembrane receptor protein